MTANQGGMRYTHKSGVAQCAGHERTLEIDYGGLITQLAFHRLDRKVQPVRCRHALAFERMYQAITPFSAVVVPDGIWLPGTPPSVVLVREDQYEKSIEFCRVLARRGIIRLTYLMSEIDQAQAFSDSVLARS